MTRDQRIVAIGSASGIAAMVAAMIGLYHVLPVRTDLGGIADRLGFALQADLIAALPLLVAIISVANARFLSEAIDPTLQRESQAMVINGRVADNSLQQLVLFLVSTAALSTTLASEQMRAILAAAIVFFAARFAFWIGYRIHPRYRAFGMGATIYLNMGLLGYALWRGVAMGMFAG